MKTKSPKNKVEIEQMSLDLKSDISNTESLAESDIILKKRNQRDYKRVRYDDRVNIIFDSEIHNMSLHQLVSKY